MTTIRAVLLDWRGTLAHCPPPRWWAERALVSVGLPVTDGTLAPIAAALNDAGALEGIDSSAGVHREATMSAFRRHGLDPKVAEALYALDADPANHPLYPDAEPVLRAIRARGVAVAVVSDFHVDLRQVLAMHGLGGLVDAWVISFEHGAQKPDPRMFTLALDMLGVSPGDALMVGDRAATDGGAAAVGITTLILPSPPEHLEERGLDCVLRVVG